METDKLVKIKSGISQAYWCDTVAKIAKFQAAEIAFDTPNQTLSWFDKLFDGGISLPKGKSAILRPITMLVSGPPGCGKTTLISELCYRLAVNEQKNDDALSTLYISTDTETSRMIDNAADLGWDNAKKYFIPFDPDDASQKWGGRWIAIHDWCMGTREISQNDRGSGYALLNDRSRRDFIG